MDEDCNGSRSSASIENENHSDACGPLACTRTALLATPANSDTSAKASFSAVNVGLGVNMDATSTPDLVTVACSSDQKARIMEHENQVQQLLQVVARQQAASTDPRYRAIHAEPAFVPTVYDDNVDMIKTSQLNGVSVNDFRGWRQKIMDGKDDDAAISHLKRFSETHKLARERLQMCSKLQKRVKTVFDPRKGDDDFSYFLQCSERRLQPIDADASKKLLLLPDLLEGPARDFYENLGERDKFSYGQLCQVMCRQFCPVDKGERYKQEINRQLEFDERVQSFVNQIRGGSAATAACYGSRKSTSPSKHSGGCVGTHTR